MDLVSIWFIWDSFWLRKWLDKQFRYDVSGTKTTEQK
jgi:hypothetical protein